MASSESTAIVFNSARRKTARDSATASIVTPIRQWEFTRRRAGMLRRSRRSILRRSRIRGRRMERVSFLDPRWIVLFLGSTRVANMMTFSCAGVVLLGPVPCFVYCCVRYGSLLARWLLRVSFCPVTDSKSFTVSTSSEMEGAIVSPYFSMTYPYDLVCKSNRAPLLSYRSQLFSPV